MCGICGILSFNGQPIKKEQISAMSNALIHRGPDDEGNYFSNSQTLKLSNSKLDTHIGLGFRRLSIIDLAGGHQPMRYKNNVIVFNGEIYNFRELRSQCQSRGHQFKTQSDTEVLLHLYDEFSEKCLDHLNGMFAFAIWNEEKKELFLARDRLGIKPLYYFYEPAKSKFIFASEIKSLYRSGEMPLEFDPIGLMDFFTYRFAPSPYTVLKKVRKVPPGHFLCVKDGYVKESSYWSVNPDAASLKDREIEWFEKELFDLLEDSVRSQMISDVPLGAFLSGGVDSSLVTALMVKNSKEKVKTFSIGFEKSTGVDESIYARKVAKFLGTDHNEFILTEKDLTHTDKMFSTMVEPVADPTILPTAILSEFARKKVKVVLTGEGGDELFAGYNRYKSVLYSQWVKKFPSFLQPVAAMAFRKSGRGDCFRAIPDVTPQNWFFLNRDFCPELLQQLFRSDEYLQWKSYLPDVTRTVSSSFSLQDPLNTILELERRTALADRLLMKVDMAAMGQSLEARPPYLDHRVVEFAWQVPSKYKIRFFKGKYLLRKVAEKVLPKSICWRKKHGFIVPLNKWVTAHSKDWLQSVLESPLSESDGLFNKEAIQKKVEKIYNKDDGEDVALLWPVIVLSLWLKSLKN